MLGPEPLGGHYSAIVKQGLTEAPHSEEEIQELIRKVDAEIIVPEIVRGDKVLCASVLPRGLQVIWFNDYWLIFNSCHVVALLRIYRVDLKMQEYISRIEDVRSRNKPTRFEDVKENQFLEISRRESDYHIVGFCVLWHKASQHIFPSAKAERRGGLIS